MNSIPFAFLIVFCVAIWEFGSTNPVALSCDSCGSECARACGTRHFRSCCFNYVKKRTTAFHPYSLNQLRYEMLYRQLPYGYNKEKLQSKQEQEPKPRGDSPRTPNKISLLNDVTDDGNLKNYNKPWKEGFPVEIVEDDYDEHRPQLEPRQQILFDA